MNVSSLNIPAEIFPLVPFAAYFAIIGLGFVFSLLCGSDNSNNNRSREPNLAEEIRDIVLRVEEKVGKLSASCSCNLSLTLPPTVVAPAAAPKQKKPRSVLRPLKTIRSKLQRVIRANLNANIRDLEDLEDLVQDEIEKIEDPDWKP